MFVCVDVGYHDSGARAAAVTFERWEDAEVSGEYSLDIAKVEPYVPGQFYKRELPCLLAVLDVLPTKLDVLVIDGYVWLDGNNQKGLGGHLFEALGESSAVIGVAKTQFATPDGPWTVEDWRFTCSNRQKGGVICEKMGSRSFDFFSAKIKELSAHHFRSR